MYVLSPIPLIQTDIDNWMKMHHRVYEYVGDWHDRLQDIIPFSFRETFAPDPKEPDLLVADILVGIVSLGVLSAGTFADKSKSEI